MALTSEQLSEQLITSKRQNTSFPQSRRHSQRPTRETRAIKAGLRAPRSPVAAKFASFEAPQRHRLGGISIPQSFPEKSTEKLPPHASKLLVTKRRSSEQRVGTSDGVTIMASRMFVALLGLLLVASIAIQVSFVLKPKLRLELSWETKTSDLLGGSVLRRKSLTNWKSRK